MSYVIVFVGALFSAAVIGGLSGLFIDFIAHTRWVSVLGGIVTGTIAFVLGIIKTVLEIIAQRLDIDKKRAERQKSNATIIEPTKEEIAQYGGVVYRQVTREAHLIVNQREHLEPREFVAHSEETWRGEPR